MASKPWTQEEKTILSKNYLLLAKGDLMSILPGRTWGTIITRATTMKLGSRKMAGLLPRQYTFDYRYFENIDTEAKAYWLGFIYADGSVSNNTLRIGLIVEALTHLTKFKDTIAFTGPIGGPYTNREKGVYNKYTINLCHPLLLKDLVSKGVVRNKTFKLEFPWWLDKELWRHFIRGVFDGDGTITTGTTKYKDKVYITPHFGICGGVPSFLKDIVQVFEDEVGTEKVKVVKSGETNTHHFAYGGTPALRIRDWMYDGASVWMECKHSKFYLFDYSSNRPHDKKHQEEKIDKELSQRGWLRLTPYLGYYEDMKFRCDKGHEWTTMCGHVKTRSGCPGCAHEATGQILLANGKKSLDERLEELGWELVSEYRGSNEELDLVCEHGRLFRMTGHSVKRPHAQCECVRRNSSFVGKQSLIEKLRVKNWELVSDYKSSGTRVTLKCQHGKEFSRYPANIRAETQCDCDGLAGSGVKGVYKQANGTWSARVAMIGTGKQKSIGTFATIAEATQAIENYRKVQA